jgi:hypothetical protein
MTRRPQGAAARRIALLAVLGLLGATSPSVAREPVLFRVSDARGDDHGAGSLVYPRRDDLGPGDLDLVELSARREGDGTRFEATFARPIASPAGRVADLSGASLESIARLGFYTFNLDLYVDQDRLPASGDTTMLPGRGASVDAAWAWETMVCLTPRPLEAGRKMRGRLLDAARARRLAEAGRVDPSEEPALAGEAEALLDARYFFPTQVRVRGRTVSLYVPDAFFQGAASPDWGYTVVVTGAQPLDRVDVKAMIGLGKRANEGLFVIPVTELPSGETFGGAPPADDLFPPIVDLLQPRPGEQEALLSGYDLRSGRPARVTGVVPGAGNEVAPR